MSKTKHLLSLSNALLLALMPVGVSALPQYTSFGPQPADTFGGTGIPNDAVARTTINVAGGGVITLDLTATQRYENPALSNDGAGTFFALPGGDVLDAKPNYAVWNFGFETNASGTLPGYSFSLLLNDSSLLSSIPLGSKDSWNLGMPFLTGGTFDPTSVQTYNLALVANDGAGQAVGKVAIDVQVGQSSAVPDATSVLALLGMGLGAMGVFARARRHQLARSTQ